MEQQLTPFEALQQATDAAGGQSALARICSVSPTAVWKWLQSAKRLPAEYVLKVEAATGVSRHLLRPDIYPRDLAPVPGSMPVSMIADQTPLCGPILSARQMGRNGNRAPILDKGEAA